MNNKKIIKLIEKYYFSHNQHLILNTREMMEDNERDCSFDIYLADSDIFLFTVQNYNAFRDLDIYFTNRFKNPKHKVVEKWDGVRASYTPLYIDQTFTLPTFKKITEEDMIFCCDYYIHEILNMWGIFNINFNEEEKI